MRKEIYEEELLPCSTGILLINEDGNAERCHEIIDKLLPRPPDKLIGTLALWNNNLLFPRTYPIETTMGSKGRRMSLYIGGAFFL
jgi:hypothetical protein